jgi:two-component system, OmpR family, heavy metal sensor histidine kinase CusS
VARSGGMRPLGDIARVADQITPSQLHKRLQPEHWPLELTSLAKAFDGMLGRLDESHRRLSQFSSDLAHELRTPIQILLGQTEVALSKDRPAEEYRRILGSNLEEFQRLTRMINELLFLARAENPTTQIERRRLDARRELEVVREFHEALAEDRAVAVICEGQAEVFAEPRLIHRAITNLLSNALRHTPRGGQIVLSVATTADAVVFKVRDSGCGIRSEDLPRIFERLYSPDRGTAYSAEGTGLGLAIVRSTAEMHGGSAAVESRPGQGTTVTLTFPAGRPVSPSTPSR